MQEQQQYKNNRELTAFVTGLCGLFKQEELLEYFKQRCEGVKSVYLPNKKNAGYAFVETKDKSSLEQLLQLKHLEFNGRELLIRQFLTGEKLRRYQEEVNSRRLFVHSIPENWIDEDLRRLFRAYGAIEDAFIIRDRVTKQSRRFGYAIFEQREVALSVAKIGFIDVGSGIIKVKVHQPKTKAKPANNYLQQNLIYQNFKRLGIPHGPSYQAGWPYHEEQRGFFGIFTRVQGEKKPMMLENNLQIGQNSNEIPNWLENFTKGRLRIRDDQHHIKPCCSLYKELRSGVNLDSRWDQYSRSRLESKRGLGLDGFGGVSYDY